MLHIIKRAVGEGATQFPGLLHFTLFPYPIILSVKQDGIKSHFLARPRIEPQSSRPWANTLLIRPMAR